MGMLRKSPKFPKTMLRKIDNRYLTVYKLQTKSHLCFFFVCVLFFYYSLALYGPGELSIRNKNGKFDKQCQNHTNTT